MKMYNHPFHLIDPSPWPLYIALNMMTIMMSMIEWFYNYNNNLLMISLIIMFIIMFQWWRDIIRESTFQGMHTFNVTIGLKIGMMLFIISEILFFISFFWSFFHSSLSPSIELGMIWPPKNINTFNPMQIPLLNTLILLTSGISITWAHHSIMQNYYYQSIQSLMFTIIMGLYFSMLQMFEYKEASFCISDSIYSSTFFLTTGFHGIHVIIGTCFILISFIRNYYNHYSQIHYFGFEAAAWYWHFIDIVWLFLYILIYWWGK